MVKERPFEGNFIWRDQEKRFSDETEILYFRKQILFETGFERCVVRISADSRYRLYVNGKMVLFGPCKGSDFRWYFETLEISEYLNDGINQIAVKVLHYPISGENLSIFRSPYGMLIFEATCYDDQDELIGTVISDESWLCRMDESISFKAGEYNTMFLGGTEQVDGTCRPFGWKELGYDDSQWESCCIYDLVDTTTGVLEPWQLYPREIPILYEREQTFKKIVASRGDILSGTSIEAIIDTECDPGCLIPAGTRLTIEIDAGELTTGFPVFTFSGGEGTIVEILYAECYEHEPIEVPWERDKGIRDDAEEGSLYGDSARYELAGVGTKEDPEVYEPFWFKTFRFIRVSLTVGDDSCLFRNISYRETGYPLEVKADFNSSDNDLNSMWDISLRTLRRCMHESYEDCPYYEQFQYTMDTYLQMLFTYQISGDDRLARKAIHDYHCSQIPQGLLQSRFPSIESQIIPGFNIYWILMVFDHYLYFRDEHLVKRYLPTIDSVLGWFDRQLNEDGLVDNIPSQYWQFVDWVDQWRAGRGVPTAASDGPLTVTNLLYAVGLQRAAELCTVLGRIGTAHEYEKRSERLLDIIRSTCWSTERNLFSDGPGSHYFSQHTQIWAILSGTITGKGGAELMRKTIHDDSLSQVSYSMAFFLMRSLSLAGIYGENEDPWRGWKRMIEMNLTTWNEDPVTQRSDCHAWGAIPLYEFTAELLGVRPESITSDRILIVPQRTSVKEIQGSVVTRGGTLYVNMREKNGQSILTIKNPDKLELIITLPNGKRFEKNCIRMKIAMEA